MREAVERRFARARLVEEEGYDRSFATLPNLVLIDGGKGQLTAALEAMAEFDLPRVAVASLAKREEEVYVPGRSAPVHLPRDSQGNMLLQRIRDEAHRFALGFHRQRRARQQTESLLDPPPRVGAKRRRALVAHLGDAQRPPAATPEGPGAGPRLPAEGGRGGGQAPPPPGGAPPGL